MIWFVPIALAWGGVVTLISRPGLAVVGAAATAKTMDFLIKEAELGLLEERMRKGINVYEERFSEQVHGTVEPLFPSLVEPDDVPGLEKAVGRKLAGNYLWKISEWNSFWAWVISTCKRTPAAQDGLWLVEIGSRRWEDAELRAEAFNKASQYKDIVAKVGMWPVEKLP